MSKDLRKEAENLLSSRFTSEELGNKSITEIIHELKVNQIELEIKNEELKNTQEELRKEAKRNAELFDYAPIAYIIIDGNTQIHKTNHAACDLLEKNRVNLNKTKLHSFIHPDCQDDFHFFFTHAKEQEGIRKIDICFSINNKKLHIKLTCNKERESCPDGNQLYRLTLADITPEKKSRDELEEVKERLELSLLGGNVAWWVWDWPSQKVSCSKKKAQMLGYEDENMAENVYEINSMIHPDDYEATMQHMRDHLSGKAPLYQLEYRMKTKNGSYKWFYDQGKVTQRAEDGSPLKIAGVVIDINDRKLTDLKLQESEHKFRKFAAMLPQVVCELDGDLNIEYVNDFGKNLFALHEKKGPFNLLDFLDDENKKHLMSAIQSVINDPEHKADGVELELTSAGGRKIHLYTYGNYDIKDGKIQKIRALGIDLSERLEMERKMNTLNQELQIQKTQLENFNKELEVKVEHAVESSRKKDHLMSLQARQAAMGEMIGNIAHQWRQPLNALGLITYDILDAYNYGELDKKYLEKSVDDANNVIQHMSQTIDDFRDFFKPLKEKSVFELKLQITKALSFLVPTLEAEGIRLDNKISNEVFTEGYPNEFSQVIINIVNNAKDAIIENKTPAGEIVIDSEASPSNITISISNNGGNIPEIILNKLFNPYFSTKTNKGGTGIGLYLAKTIIEQNMQGKISVSNISGGATFRIEIKKAIVPNY